MTDNNKQLEKAKKQPAVTSPAQLLQIAVEGGADLEKLEKLMDLQERYEKKEAKKAYLDAMMRFQNLVPKLEKTKKVGFTNRAGGKTEYAYTPLADIAEGIKASLRDCGLSYRWETQQKDQQIIVTCIVSHYDGHSEKNTMASEKDDSGKKNLIQSRASTITYLQRYTLIGALGLTTANEDNDGDTGQPSEKPKVDKREELTPDHPKWQDALDAWAQGNVTAEQIRKRYKLTDENYKLLTS